MGIEFKFCKMKKALEMVGGDVHNMNVLNHKMLKMRKKKANSTD